MKKVRFVSLFALLVLLIGVWPSVALADDPPSEEAEEKIVIITSKDDALDSTSLYGPGKRKVVPIVKTTK